MLSNAVPPLGPDAPVGEILLAETAIRIELPPSLHRLAVERYEAVRNHTERAESPLHDLVSMFYPQGSMAIRATIKSHRRDGGFDLDIIAELHLAANATPAQVLDLLFEAINGPPGSLYHGNVKRQTRCVTVEYADGMHLDLTPSILIDANDPRKSSIFHAKREEPVTSHRRLVMNSYAFIEWFNARTPVDKSFAKAYAERARILSVQAEADVKPVPAHSTVEGGKSSTVVGLQLLKRNRNINYAKRKGRMPPSVMMAEFAGQAAFAGNSISGALELISGRMLVKLEHAQAEGKLIVVENPKCHGEFFTDRWPENLAAQQLYINDLKVFRRQLVNLMNDQLSLEQKRDLLITMFGEGPARSVIDDYAELIGRSVKDATRRVAFGGRVMASPIPTAVAVSSISTPARSHTFYSGWYRKK